jgi:hypothetical protein
MTKLFAALPQAWSAHHQTLCVLRHNCGPRWHASLDAQWTKQREIVQSKAAHSINELRASLATSRRLLSLFFLC